MQSKHFARVHVFTFGYDYIASLNCMYFRPILFLDARMCSIVVVVDHLGVA